MVNLSRAILPDQSVIDWCYTGPCNCQSHYNARMTEKILSMLTLTRLFSWQRRRCQVEDRIPVVLPVFLYSRVNRSVPLDRICILAFWSGTGNDERHPSIVDSNRVLGVQIETRRSPTHSLGKGGHLHNNNERKLSLTIK